MRRKNKTMKAFVLMPIVAALLGAPGGTSPVFSAQESKPAEQKRAARDEDNRRRFTDLPVVTHEGREARFYTDLLKDRVVLISFFYTGCPSTAQDMARLSEIEKMLGDRMARDFSIVALNVDPKRDTLKVLQEHARKYRPGKGWVFVTGKKENMEQINRKFGNTNPVPEFHLRFYLMGNLKTSRWMMMEQNTPAQWVAEGLRKLAAE